MNKLNRKFNRGLLSLCLIVILAGCEQGDSLEQIQARDELMVISRNGPTTYFQDRNGPAGFEHELASLFARELGVELTMQPAFSLDAIFTSLQRSEVDFAAAGLSLTGPRITAYPHSRPYSELQPQVVYKSGQFRPRKVADLIDLRVLVLAGSSHEQSLQGLQAGGFPELHWQALEDADSMGLLELVKSGEGDVALVDSIEFAVQQSIYPRLRVAFDLGTTQELVWYLSPGRDNKRLLQRIDQFLSRLEADGTMTKLREKHFGHAVGISRISSHTFARNMRKTLPLYRDLLQQVALEYKLDWNLMAAISYQESHWNPLATSPTGVRGMMMLTLPTAREMGVENRLDPIQSLRGGARYLKNIKRRMPQDIAEPDLTWMALSAYNIGLGHLEDARVLTERQGGDPHLWADVMERLPLLQKSQYYNTTRHGYARGIESVTYVQNIRHYYNILQWQEIPEIQATPPINTEDYLPAAIRNRDFLAL